MVRMRISVQNRKYHQNGICIIVRTYRQFIYKCWISSQQKWEKSWLCCNSDMSPSSSWRLPRWICTTNKDLWLRFTNSSTEWISSGYVPDGSPIFIGMNHASVYFDGTFPGTGLSFTRWGPPAARSSDCQDSVHAVKRFGSLWKAWPNDVHRWLGEHLILAGWFSAGVDRAHWDLLWKPSITWWLVQPMISD